MLNFSVINNNICSINKLKLLLFNDTNTTVNILLYYPLNQ